MVKLTNEQIHILKHLSLNEPRVIKQDIKFINSLMDYHFIKPITFENELKFYLTVRGKAWLDTHTRDVILATFLFVLDKVKNFVLKVIKN